MLELDQMLSMVEVEYAQFGDAFHRVPENFPIPFARELERLKGPAMPDYVAQVVARMAVLITFCHDRDTPQDDTYVSLLDIHCLNPQSFSDITWHICAENVLLTKLIIKMLPVEDQLRVVVFDSIDHGTPVLRGLVDEFWQSNSSAMQHAAGLYQMLLAELLPNLGAEMRRIHKLPRNQFLNSELTYFFENEITTRRLHEVHLVFPELKD